MYSKQDTSLRVTIMWIAASLFGVWLVFVMPDSLDPVFQANWICDIICMEISLYTLMFMYSQRIIDFFSPVIFVSVLYITMFFITPIYDISVGAISTFGVIDLFDYGVKGSVVALLGFLSFCAVYAFRYRKAPRTEKPDRMAELTDTDRIQLEKWLLIAWFADLFVATLITVMTKGFSISYILSFGIFGEANASDKISASLGFIAQFTRSIVCICLLYMCVSRNKMLRRIIFILTAFSQIIHGFRYMIVIQVCGFFYFTFLSKKKKVNILYLILLSVLLTVIISFVGYARNSVRNGDGFSLTGFSLNDIVYSVVGNFRIYKSYYSIVKAVPALTDYIYFDQILFYTVIMAIPRMIWRDKPRNPGTKAQLYGMNQAAVDSGFAYPCIGEYYYGFGVFGVMFFMGVIGHWLANAAVKYRVNYSKNADLVIYSITVALMLQLLIRGYTPSNFYLVLAMYVPYWFVDSYYKKHAVTVSEDSELNEQM